MSWLKDPEVLARVQNLALPFNRDGVDPFGVSKKNIGQWLSLLSWFYRNYFDVSVKGLSHVPNTGRAMLVGNHSGGVALDAAMVLAACFLEMNPPRLGHAMAEKFLAEVHFVGTWLRRTGQVTGLPEHALQLLRAERLLLVFPEGARGTAKLYPERNSLVQFGTGFVRLAIQAKAPIVPFGFLGGGDAVPTVANLYKIGKWFGLPYLPVTPYVVPLPRPVALDVFFGEPLFFEGTGDEEDVVIQGYVDQVKERISNLIEDGQKIRNGRDLSSK